MSNANLLDKKHMVHAIVRVKEEQINFVYLTLEQAYGQHHRFEIGLDYDAAGQSFMEDPNAEIDLMGTLLTISFCQGKSHEEYDFYGVITEIRKTGRDGQHGYLILKGGSPTLMLDRGKRMDLYSDHTLEQVFRHMTDGMYQYRSNPYHIKPNYQNRIDFLLQYNETDWEFLQRIAYLYGENLFYSGSQIVFGTTPDRTPITLTYDREISDMEFCAKMLPNHLSYFQYISDHDLILQKESTDKLSNSNRHLDNIFTRSKSILTAGRPPVNKLGAPISSRPELDELVNKDMTRTAANTMYLTGRAKTYEVNIGRLISIRIPEGMSKTSELGTYRITKSIHRITDGNRYSNEFEAVPASLQTIPVTEPVMPMVDSLIGKVRDNNDPTGQGRVVVDFAFSPQYNFSWMRVMSPSAGLGAEGAKNRGMVFIPEEGDQVMVGFEFGDPNRPYVMGSMFHGKNAKGGGEQNHIKSIITKSGHTIEFDDALDSMGITIKDSMGNSIRLDTKGKNIEITAPKNIILNAENIQLNASENVDISAKKITENAKENISQMAKKMDVTIDTDYTLLSKNIKEMADKIDIYSQVENLTLFSKKNVETYSGSKKIKLS